MEKVFVKFLSEIFSLLNIRGLYRFVSLFYPYKRTRSQNGIWLTKKYLARRYNLLINLYSKDLIDHKILFTGSYEPDTNHILEQYVKPGFTVLEAGANSGTETLLISRLVGQSGKVLAFEPVPHVVSKLKDNLSLNQISNVQVFSHALGEKDCEISFFVYPLEHPNQGMGSKILEKAGLKKIAVRQKPIDVLFREGLLRNFNFLKMDVQGSELDILKGGRDSILLLKPEIFLEAGDGWSNIMELFNYLIELGYTPYCIDKFKLVSLNEANLKAGNWLAIPKCK